MLRRARDRMKFVPTRLPEVVLIEPRVFGDARGFFMETWNAREVRRRRASTLRFVQDNHSHSRQGVLRGLHYQMRQPQGKLVRVTRGEVFDVAVDLRTSLADVRPLGRVEHLSAANNRMMWVPPGFAHGFLALERARRLPLQMHRLLRARARAHAAAGTIRRSASTGRCPRRRRRWSRPRTRRRRARDAELLSMKVVDRRRGGPARPGAADAAPAGVELVASAARSSIITTRPAHVAVVARSMRRDRHQRRGLHSGGPGRSRPERGAMRSTRTPWCDRWQRARQREARASFTSRPISSSTARRPPYRPGDATDPLSVYGAASSRASSRSRAVRSRLRASCAPRGSMPQRGRNFVLTMLRLCRERDEVRVVADQIGTPTGRQSLADALWRAGRTQASRGILHWTDAGVASWYDFAVAIEEESAARSACCERRSGSCRSRPPSIRRRRGGRRFSVLDKRATWSPLGSSRVHWRANLRESCGSCEA